MGDESKHDFEEDLEFGKIGEDFFIKVLKKNSLKFDDLRDDKAARAIDVDFRLHFPIIGPTLIDVKTHNDWDRLPIETFSNKEKGVLGCDETSHAKYFVHIFPLIHTVLVVDRQKFVDYVKSTKAWEEIEPEGGLSHRNGEKWPSEHKNWDFSRIPGYGEGMRRGVYPFDWWVKFDFEFTEEIFRMFWESKKFRKAAKNYDKMLMDSFNFKLNDFIRCPFCLDKGRPGNMKVVPNGDDGSLFFSCKTCLADIRNMKLEGKKTGGMLAGFDLDGWKRYKSGAPKKYAATYPLFILRLLGKSDDIGIVE